MDIKQSQLTMASESGQHKQDKNKYIPKHSPHSRGIQEPAVFLPGQRTDNVRNIWDNCAKPNSYGASDHRNINTSAVSETGETGASPMNGQP